MRSVIVKNKRIIIIHSAITMLICLY